MLPREELEKIVKDTRGGARDVKQHLYNARYEARHRILKKMEVPVERADAVRALEARELRASLAHIAVLQAAVGIGKEEASEAAKRMPLGLKIRSFLMPRGMEAELWAASAKIPSEQVERVVKDAERTLEEVRKLQGPRGLPLRARAFLLRRSLSAELRKAKRAREPEEAASRALYERLEGLIELGNELKRRVLREQWHKYRLAVREADALLTPVVAAQWGVEE